jgi:hypothetical protein
MGIAMHAIEVALAGYIPDNNRLFIYGKLQEMGREIPGPSTITKGVRRLNCPTI